MASVQQETRPGKEKFSEKSRMSNPSDNNSDTDDHRDETFEVDKTRWEQLMQMTRTAWSRDNQKQVVKILSKKDRKMSSVAVEKMKTLNKYSERI